MTPEENRHTLVRVLFSGICQNFLLTNKKLHTLYDFLQGVQF